MSLNMWKNKFKISDFQKAKTLKVANITSSSPLLLKVSSSNSLFNCVIFSCNVSISSLADCKQKKKKNQLQNSYINQ